MSGGSESGRQKRVAATSAEAPQRVPAAASAPPRSGKGREPRPASKRPARLVSLDAYRGFIMAMLAASGFGIAGFAALDSTLPVWTVQDHARWERVAFHFDHPEWVSVFGLAGVSFWDLIQPAFMFMVGVAMPFSYERRRMMGASWLSNTVHATVRAAVLVLLGVFLASLDFDFTVWVFPNVLCQIGLGYLFAYALLGRKPLMQAGAAAAILIGYWMFFFFNPPPENFEYSQVGVTNEEQADVVFEGRFSPWSKNSNIAHRFDVWFLNKLRSPKPAPEESGDDSGATASSNSDDPPQSPAVPSNGLGTEPTSGALSEIEATGAEVSGDAVVPAATGEPGLLRRWLFRNPEPFVFNRGGYTTLNFVPSIATTLIGILCGQLILAGAGSRWKTLLILAAASAGCLALGVAAHHTVCPIVKRIWTPSWVLFSAGYAIGLLALFYLLFDLLPLKWLAFPLVVIGMNSILIYMAGQMLRGWTVRVVVRRHFGPLLESIFGSRLFDEDWYARLAEPTAFFVVIWLMAAWLYRQRIFVRI